MYYLDDQSVGGSSEKEMNWKHFELFVKETSGNLLLDIPMFLKNKDYQKYFLNLKKTPLSFVDDFRDLQFKTIVI